MPKIQWSGLPEALRTHLLLRLKERQVTEQDLLKLMEWRQSDPEAPDGLWYKDFGSFKTCGEGRYPKTFLVAVRAARESPTGPSGDGARFDGVLSRSRLEDLPQLGVERTAVTLRPRLEPSQDSPLEIANREARYLEILNASADVLNREMEDILAFQANLEAGRPPLQRHRGSR